MTDTAQPDEPSVEELTAALHADGSVCGGSEHNVYPPFCKGLAERVLGRLATLDATRAGEGLCTNCGHSFTDHAASCVHREDAHRRCVCPKWNVGAPDHE